MNVVSRFSDMTEKIKYRPRAIFPSEMFLFYHLAIDFTYEDAIMESGSGISTFYLLALFPKVPITTVDKNIGHVFKIKAKNLSSISGNSLQLLPKIIRNSPARRIAVLIDGPKNEEAMILTRSVMEDNRVKFVAVHDLPSQMSERGIFNTRIKQYRDLYGGLDYKVSGDYAEKYPDGPGLTIFSNYGNQLVNENSFLHNIKSSG